MKSCKKFNIICCVIFLYWVSGCSIPTQNSDSNLLQTSKMIHKKVSQIWGNPQENIIRQDWPPEEYKFLENIYIYSLPYFPYMISNCSLIYLKEAVLFPAWLVVGGTSFQDEADLWIIDHNLGYQNIFANFWPNENSHANFINMDEWPK